MYCPKVKKLGFGYASVCFDRYRRGSLSLSLAFVFFGVAQCNSKMKGLS